MLLCCIGYANIDDNFSDDSGSFIVLLMAKDDGSHYNDGHGWSCGIYSDGGVFDLSFFALSFCAP